MHTTAPRSRRSVLGGMAAGAAALAAPAAIAATARSRRDTYVLVHGAFHTGELLGEVARHIRVQGHIVHTPTLAGNRPGDNRATTGLADAVRSLVEYVEQRDLKDIRLCGHSYGGMVISGATAHIAPRIRRIVYQNAFVPVSGESQVDIMKPGAAAGVALFEQIAAQNNGAVLVPYPIWRDALMNDASEELARRTYKLLNPHPFKTMTDKLTLPVELAAQPFGKSYLNAQQDIAFPHSFPWHPRLSERLGLYRLVECQGGHELCFTNPKLLAQKLIEAGRD